ncbi:hypothetical protein L1F29_27480 [Paenibacillus spongiae]|uniref:Uncharacterized protein n=1 Tax=Paenibacillus spongiae TaxID=2909671 RepID=A0ABY5SJJ7_9BACL|nr:hypothetical protein L1F29_27480 [Paenibacillus spongiae]
MSVAVVSYVLITAIW